MNYPANVREYARRLHKANGWSAYRIRKALEGRVDPVPAEDTIRMWVDKEARQAHLDRGRRYGPPGPKKHRLWERRLERLKELKALGLSETDVARVMNHDFGLDLNRDKIERMLSGEVRKPATLHKQLAPGVKAPEEPKEVKPKRPRAKECNSCGVQLLRPARICGFCAEEAELAA